MAKDWSTEIDRISQEFKDAFGQLTEEKLNFKPNDNTWSIAQNIDHLIVINSSYFPILDQVASGKYTTPFMGNFRWFAKMIGKSILKSVDPSNSKRVNTFPTWQPSIGNISADILDRFDEHQNELKIKLKACSSKVDKGMIIHSPVNSKIVYPLGVAFEIIVSHEQRHFNQAEGIKDQFVNEM